jgi:serine protease Do
MKLQKKTNVMLIAAILLCPNLLASTDMSGTDVLSQISNAFTEISDKASPAVVSIRVTLETEMPAMQGFPNFPFNSPFDPFGNDFFYHFFGTPPGGQQQNPQPNYRYSQVAEGSGFIVSKDGYIMTNNHVVSKATKIMVKIGNEPEIQAELVGTDPDTDVAVIRVKTDKDLPVMDLGDSDKIQVGQLVLAIGNPFGLPHTVTEGIISAKGRSDIHLTTYENFIQTDAAINPGNSGGPLIDLNGRAIGINTAIVGASSNAGIGLAIPINMAKMVYEQLIKNGKVVRGYLGVNIQELTPELAKSFGYPQDTKGVLIGQVVNNSPAAKAGIEQGDIVIELNGKPITKATELQYEVSILKPDTEAKIVVLRNGEKKTLTVTLGEKPTTQPKIQPMPEESNVLKGLGIDVQDLTQDLADRFGYKGLSGVIVTQVESGSPADEKGIQAGMLIMEVNRKPVTNVREFRNAIREASHEKSVLLLVNDSGHSFYVVLNFPQD